MSAYVDNLTEDGCGPQNTIDTAETGSPRCNTDGLLFNHEASQSNLIGEFGTLKALSATV
jgi:hypothetical protein